WVLCSRGGLLCLPDQLHFVNTVLTARLQLREPEYQTATWMKTLLQKLLSSITQVIAERCQLKNFATTTRWVR
ncbi:hypothetical protein, partial [Escherichia coli]|uniref:hypothetical protein n=1 Tax=Escherichia coli TaxID=562 RepID=UPI001F150955